MAVHFRLQTQCQSHITSPAEIAYLILRETRPEFSGVSMVLFLPAGPELCISSVRNEFWPYEYHWKHLHLSLRCSVFLNCLLLSRLRRFAALSGASVSWGVGQCWEYLWQTHVSNVEEM